MFFDLHYTGNNYFSYFFGAITRLPPVPPSLVGTVFPPLEGKRGGHGSGLRGVWGRHEWRLRHGQRSSRWWCIRQSPCHGT